MKTLLKDERIGKTTFTRRDALKLAGTAGVMAALPWSGIAEAEAAAPALKGPQAGGYYRFAIGEIEAIVISDGGLSFQPIQP
ncbi:MAG: twin-arginine translocation signal domain-containing protein, partial [Candidatus Deferrimicrobiaceae bacterium]